jgi:hypothetical protein
MWYAVSPSPRRGTVCRRARQRAGLGEQYRPRARESGDQDRLARERCAGRRERGLFTSSSGSPDRDLHGENATDDYRTDRSHGPLRCVDKNGKGSPRGVRGSGRDRRDGADVPITGFNFAVRARQRDRFVVTPRSCARARATRPGRPSAPRRRIGDHSRRSASRKTDLTRTVSQVGNRRGNCTEPPPTVVLSGGGTAGDESCGITRRRQKVDRALRAHLPLTTSVRRSRRARESFRTERSR